MKAFISLSCIRKLPAFFLLPLLLTACGSEEAVQDVRPVRAVTVATSESSDSPELTGQVRAREEVNLSFRLSGKLVSRSANVGDKVRAGQILARLDPDETSHARSAAQADFAAAQAALEQARAAEKRAAALLKEEAVSRAEYESTLRQFKAADEQVKAARAKLANASDQVGYTLLRAAGDGVITAKWAEAGEVVRAGQSIVSLARQRGKDVVFDVPANIVRAGLANGQKMDVWLADAPEIRAHGVIREIAPQADAATRTHAVKLTLEDAPAALLLGSTVVGRLQLKQAAHIELPASALMSVQQQAAVWVIGADSAVHLRAVTVVRYTQDNVIIASGLANGEQVVTAGVQVLREGQKVKLLGATP